MNYDHGSTRLAYNASDDLEYFGQNTIDGVDGSLATWLVSKLIYAGGDLSYIEGPIMGIWDDRAALAWS